MGGDLISREAALRAMQESFGGIRIVGMRFGKTLLSNLLERMSFLMSEAVRMVPAVDAAPVVHGRWSHTTKEDDDWGGTFHRFTCSECDWSMGDNPDGWGNYCPNCGAKMDLEEE